MTTSSKVSSFFFFFFVDISGSELIRKRNNIVQNVIDLVLSNGQVLNISIASNPS